MEPNIPKNQSIDNSSTLPTSPISSQPTQVTHVQPQADNFTLLQFLKALFQGNWSLLKIYLKTGKGFTTALFLMVPVAGIFAALMLLISIINHTSYELPLIGLVAIAIFWYLGTLSGILTVLHKLFKRRFRHAIGLFLFFLVIGLGSCALTGGLGILLSTFVSITNLDINF